MKPIAENNLPASAMENTVFGHEIFSNKNLSFAPDLYPYLVDFSFPQMVSSWLMY